MEARTCARCGEPVEETWKACVACATRLPRAEGVEEEVATVRPARPRWVLPSALAGLIALVVAVGLLVAAAVPDEQETPVAGPDDTVEPGPTTQPLGTEPALPSDTELVEQNALAIWKVEIDGCGARTHATAWAVDDRHLVTSADVVLIDPTPVVRSHTGRPVDAALVGIDAALDVAVLTMPETLEHTLAWADTAALGETDRIIGVGYGVEGVVTATPGRLAGFGTEGDVRTTVHTDVPFDHGHRGGPILTERGEVAGVIGLVDGGSLEAMPNGRSGAGLRPAIEWITASPQALTADCTVVERVVPPVDEEQEPSTTTTTGPGASVPSGNEAECPTALAYVAVEDVSARRESPDAAPESWTVTVRGNVRNDGSATIILGMIKVEVPGSPETHLGLAATTELRGGESTTFTATAYVESPSEPTSASADMDDWTFSDPDLIHCEQ